MQMQLIGQPVHLAVLGAVFGVTQDGKTDRRAMYAQLVGAPGNGLEFHQR